MQRKPHITEATHAMAQLRHSLSLFARDLVRKLPSWSKCIRSGLQIHRLARPRSAPERAQPVVESARLCQLKLASELCHNPQQREESHQGEYPRTLAVMATWALAVLLALFVAGFGFGRVQAYTRPDQRARFIQHVNQDCFIFINAIWCGQQCCTVRGV